MKLADSSEDEEKNYAAMKKGWQNRKRRNSCVNK